ncbi:MAG: ABC transporter ATP-binding protein/permease [Clostridia bacterium]|nr:ABC transporter ATP-binding protein/permease [Clostridia bacterium]
MIRIKNLNKFFNQGKQNEIHVINDVSLDLPEKGMVAIFGKSGCGKTTLLNVIGGLDKYASGELTIENQSIRENTDEIRNKYIGYIFQNYNLNKNETCFQNVADALYLCGMTDEGEIEKRVITALSNVGMEKFKERTPDTLSGGQQQRIAIARAIVKNPRIILADEPTGNLDEANTVMIMDLLKAISKDHLVVLVTHEANLVDFYCDTVVELSDGKIESIKNNESAEGFLARDKNHIYLGELEKSELKNESAQIEYYGDVPKAPIKLKIINSGGKLYVQIGTEKVQIIDEFSEIKLKDGVYEEKAHISEKAGSIDMSSLPPVTGTHHGKLFNLKSSIKSGYASNFKNGKRGKSILRRCMGMFAAVIVFMSAFFGTAIGDIIQAKRANNQNVFYLYTPNYEVSKKLNDAINNSETGIDFVRLTEDYPYGDGEVYFHTGSFETFMQAGMTDSFGTNAAYLDVSVAKDYKLICGKKDNLSDDEILISTKVADALLEKSNLGYIEDRKDLLGLICTAFTIDGKSVRIAGVVESNESAIYLTRLAMARYTRSSIAMSRTFLASKFGFNLSKGEAILVQRNMLEGREYPSVGDVATIQGMNLTVREIMYSYNDYESWLVGNKIKKVTDYEYFTNLVMEQNPQLEEGTDEFFKVYNEIFEERYFEYYEYFYSDFKQYCRDTLFFDPYYFEMWLYAEKGVEDAKYALLPEQFYKANEYKKLYGHYPTILELENMYGNLPYLDLKQYFIAYENEFYSLSKDVFNDSTYLLSDEDYINTTKMYGKTDAIVNNNLDYNLYTVIHSVNPKLTEEWLKGEFSEIEPPNEYWKTLITPNDLFENVIYDNVEEIITSIITMIVILALMSLCMYFIMRSSLMNRIKEVGIYRAIGVTKKNLIFKFFIEAVVLTLLTVLVGYILVSIFLYACLSISPLVSEIFFYPVWLAGIDLLILFAISLFFGTLPILSLLRKTPSEILSKYDI